MHASIQFDVSMKSPVKLHKVETFHHETESGLVITFLIYAIRKTLLQEFLARILHTLKVKFSKCHEIEVLLPNQTRLDVETHFHLLPF